MSSSNIEGKGGAGGAGEGEEGDETSLLLFLMKPTCKYSIVMRYQEILDFEPQEYLIYGIQLPLLPRRKTLPSVGSYECSLGPPGCSTTFSQGDDSWTVKAVSLDLSDAH